MARHGTLTTPSEARSASHEALRGGLHGAARWGLIFGVLGVAGYVFSPVYRALTPQFKVYIQMSGMTFGGMVEAERRVREVEARARRMRKLARDEEAWRRYEEGFEREVEAEVRKMEGKGRAGEEEK